MSSSSSARRADVETRELKLPEVIERIGFGPAQARFCLTGGGVYLADGSELLLISAVTQAVSSDWKLGPFQRGFVVTVVFVGCLLGNFSSGFLGDRIGRRTCIISSYLGIFFFSIFSSLSNGYVMLCMLRLLVGLSFGIGQPAWNTLSTEVTPRFWRIPMSGISQLLFVVGEIYSTLLILSDDPNMKNLHWRRLLQLGAVPSILFALASMFFLLPSPSFLAIQGKHKAARDVLEIMKKENNADVSVSTNFCVDPAAVTKSISRSELGSQLKKVFGRYLLPSTLITSFTCFNMNLVYYGSLYAFPQVLPSVHTDNTAGLQLLVGALWEIPGNAAGIIFGMWLPRKPVIKLSMGFTAISLLSFVIGITTESMQRNHWISDAMYHVGYYGIKSVGTSGFVVVYQYAAEIYPTEMRTTGSAVCLGMGRLGAMLAPLIFEGLLVETNGFSGFFFLLCFSAMINVLLIDFLPFETSDAVLNDHLGPDDEANPYDSVDSEKQSAFEDSKKEKPYGSVDNARQSAFEESNKEGEISGDLDDGCTTPP